MIETPTLEDLKNHRIEFPNSMACIIIAPKFSNKGYSDIMNRIGYLNLRSGQNLHFYCAGYGAYLPPSFAPDIERLPDGKVYEGTLIPWSFSQTLFAKFINELEDETNWKYSGNTELILLNQNLDFKNCIVFKIDEMIKDKIIESANDIIEALIQESKQSSNVSKVSLEGLGKVSIEETITAILTYLPKPFESIWNIWKKGKHFTLVDLK